MDYKYNLNNFINENIDQNKLQERLFNGDIDKIAQERRFNSDDDLKIQEKFFNMNIKEKNQDSLYNFYDRKKNQITEKNTELYNTIKTDPEDNIYKKYEQKFEVFTDRSSYWISKKDYEMFKRILGDKDEFKELINYCEEWFNDVYITEGFIKYVVENTFLPKYVPQFILVKTHQRQYYSNDDTKKDKSGAYNDITIKRLENYLQELENKKEKDQEYDVEPEPSFVVYPPIFDEGEDKENGRSR